MATMNNAFKKRLYDLYYDTSADFGKIRAEKEYERIIAAGMAVERGENYYLFVYTDIFAHPVRIGSIALLYKAYDSINPIDIHFFIGDLGFEMRDKFIRAAVFALRHQMPDTIKPELFRTKPQKRPAGMQQPCEFVEGLRDAHLLKLKEMEERIEAFKTTGFQQQYCLAEEVLVLPKAVSVPEELKARLAALSAPPVVSNNDSSEDTETKKKPRARIGLCLEIRPLEPGEEESQLSFHPLVVPILKNGGVGKPRKATRSLLATYDIDRDALPVLLENFLNRFVCISAEKLYDTLKIKLLNQIYFLSLAAEIFAMPDDCTYYSYYDAQVNPAENRYQQMQKIRFQSIHLQFVPGLEHADTFVISLGLIGTDGREIRVGNRYEIRVIEQQHFLFVVGGDGCGYFAVPVEGVELASLFHFLAMQKEFPVTAYRAVVKALKALESQALKISTGSLKKYRLSCLPLPVLNIIDKNKFTGTPGRIKLEFDYDTPLQDYIGEHPGLTPILYEGRQDPLNREFERICLLFLLQDPLLVLEPQGSGPGVTPEYYFNLRESDGTAWLTQVGSYYLERGFTLFSTAWNRPIRRVGSSIHLHIQYGIQWLEFNPTLGFGDQELQIADVDFNSGIVIDNRGDLHLVTGAELEKLQRLHQYAEKHDEGFRVPAGNFMLINRLYDERMALIPELKERLETAERLKALEEIPDYGIGAEFQGQLRNYQHSGYRWLRFLQQYGFPGCLADDMGLGKTVQTLALLQSLKSEGQLKTSLLVAPVSALPNWGQEINRFAPTLKWHLHVGIKRDKSSENWENMDVIITSYATLRQDIESFQGFSFDYIILDESQNIKNVSSQVSRAVKLLVGRHRLTLSGTPVENNSMELWSMFDFLIPGFLGSSQWFYRQFTVPIEKEQNRERAEVLKKIVYPFILRRKKEEVERELPEKIEIITRLEMGEAQMALYRELAELFKQEVAREIDARGVGGSSIKIMEALLRLRQICLFPRLVHHDYQNIPSAKFDHFMELIEDILAEGHKVLIFSQFVKVLHVIRDHFERQDIRYSYLDGAMKMEERGEMIERFQKDEEVKTFLLSLKAGGTAITLTAADYVIIFDPWWNPAVEAQAIDRSHRIGQTRNVIVYRLVIANSIEEKMLALQQKKMDLVEQLIAADLDAQKFRNLTKIEILDLFDLKPEKKP